MKISLNMDTGGPDDKKQVRARALGRDILAAKSGDWNAKNNLVRSYMPLLTSLAQKRAGETAQVNVYVEAGKEGIYTAAKKYKKNMPPGEFQV